MPCSSSRMVGRLVAPAPEEEPAELSVGGRGEEGGGSRVMGGRGAGGLVRGEGGGEGGVGEGVAGGDSSCFTPGRAEGEDDGFLFPECGKKLEREREAATAPHSCKS